MQTTSAVRARPLPKSVALIVTVLTALMLAAGALAAIGNVKDARAADVVELTYTVWFSPQMTGVVGGDFNGTFGGGVSSTPIPDSPLVQLNAVYVIDASSASQSFTANVTGNLNTETHSAVLNGEVTSGFLNGEQAHSQFDVIGGCPGKPKGPCFQGTLRLM